MDELQFRSQILMSAFFLIMTDTQVPGIARIFA